MTDMKEYAKALFLLTEEDGTTDAALAELGTVRQLLTENPEYRNLLDTPALPKDERLALIDEAFSGISEYVKNLLKILCEKHMIFALARLCTDFAAIYDEARGIERAEAISAVAMTDAQLTALKEKLESITGKTVIIKNTTDPGLIGGVKLRYGGIQLDGSVKTRLESFERALRKVVI
jgi:ATP synthase F1 delta subunit